LLSHTQEKEGRGHDSVHTARSPLTAAVSVGFLIRLVQAE
jgi:hypothetical protein